MLKSPERASKNESRAEKSLKMPGEYLSEFEKSAGYRKARAAYPISKGAKKKDRISRKRN